MTESVGDLIFTLQDSRVQFYLAILGFAIWKCTRIYKKTLRLASNKINGRTRPYGSSSEGKKEEIPSTCRVLYIGPPILSIIILGVTWFYIFRFILIHQHTSKSYFDDAYKDVLKDHYFSSTQLLTWAIVSVVWVSSSSDVGTGNGIPFLFYGFLGAMGASFVLWIPSTLTFVARRNVIGKRTFVPTIFAITSIIAFYCIIMIQPCQDGEIELSCLPDQGFGSFQESFRFYLHGLHYILLFPIGFNILVPAKKQIQLDSTLFYGVLGIAFAIWNISQILHNPSNKMNTGILSPLTLYSVPETDCQKSIHIDLLCCSLLTLYTIHHHYHGLQVRKSHRVVESLRALHNTFIAALFIPLISPAAVLSIHLCIKSFPFTYRDLVGKMQREIAWARRKQENKRQKSCRKTTHEKSGPETFIDEHGWCNLGLWKKNDKNADSYDEACENLATALAETADLKSGDGVLSIGCGSGKEVDFFFSRFGLDHITGVDPVIHIDASSFDVQNVRKIQASVEDLICNSDSVPVFRPRLFNKVVALDNVYHYADKLAFFGYCKRILNSTHGKIAVTDIIWKQNQDSVTFIPYWFVKLALSAMGVSSNVWTQSEYKNNLESLGFHNISVKSIGKEVFMGWKSILPSFVLQQLDYCIIVANTGSVGDDIRSIPKIKKRIAIIGSGMAGLAATYTICNSYDAKDIEVTVFESAQRAGLAGNSMKIGKHIVDVPARMAALGYYHHYIDLIHNLGIKYEVVKTDCIFHGGNGNGGYVKYIYERSSLKNFLNAVTVGGLRNLWKMMKVFSSIPCLLQASSKNELDYSFGDWLHIHLNLYPSSSRSKYFQSDQQQDWSFPFFAQHENAFLYMAIGSFGWMLSCTYRQLINCPAKILLPYIDGLGLTRYLGIFNEGSVVRIKPSIKALEHAILYGVNFKTNSKIVNLDERKVIHGIKYDAVICATEANAVPYVVRGCPDVFREFKYHPSTIYLHTDNSFLPKNRSDWRTWEVRMEPDQDEPQLTFWLNRYYGHIDFEGDVFQTWAALRPPKEKYIIAKFDMVRVIHTNISKNMVELVQNEQGKDGFYFAGSYAVNGMGLLEQAAQSGKLAGEFVLKNLLSAEQQVK